MGFSALGLCLVFLEETYPPVILVGKASELRRRTKNWGIVSILIIFKLHLNNN